MRAQSNPPALENNLLCALPGIVWDRSDPQSCHRFTCGSSICASLCCSRWVKAGLEDFLYPELYKKLLFEASESSSGLLLGRVVSGCTRAPFWPPINLVWRQQKNARVSSALFPPRKPRSGNEGNSLSLPFSPSGLISQHCCWQLAAWWHYQREIGVNSIVITYYCNIRQL